VIEEVWKERSAKHAKNGVAKKSTASTVVAG
jgi:hypothetical protein